MNKIKYGRLFSFLHRISGWLDNRVYHAGHSVFLTGYPTSLIIGYLTRYLAGKLFKNKTIVLTNKSISGGWISGQTSIWSDLYPCDVF